MTLAPSPQPWAALGDALLRPLPADWRFNIQQAFSNLGEAVGKLLGGGQQGQRVSDWCPRPHAVHCQRVLLPSVAGLAVLQARAALAQILFKPAVLNTMHTSQPIGVHLTAVLPRLPYLQIGGRRF